MSRTVRASHVARCATFALVAATAMSADTSAQAPAANLTSVADKVFAEWNNTHGPGCAVGVSRAGKALLTRGYGMADIQGDRPITPNTILESGSVAKQFTAAAVLLLMQDGKLSLEDDARKYLPELPVYDRPITVRHLLTHTSGLREWSNLFAWQGWPRGTRVHTQSDFLDIIVRQKSLNYPVGTYYSYTNSGFLLLRTLVERVSGQSFEQFSADRIFTPLGMRNTRWRGDYTRLVPGLAQAYGRQADGWHLNMPFDNIIGAGGLLTTVGDWLIWNDALTAKTLGSAVGDSITRQMKLNSGLEIQYALGLTVSKYRGLKQIGHSGSTAGYSTFLARYPDADNLSIAVMCNAAGAPATAYTHALVDAIVPSMLAAAAAPPPVVTVAPTELQQYAGIYRDTRTNTLVNFSVADGRLRRGATALRPTGNGVFGAGGNRVNFVADARGTMSFRQPTADGDTVVYVREATSLWTPTPAELSALAGRYHNDEIDVTFTVAVVDGRLSVSPRAGIREMLTPMYRDAFDAGGESVWFTRDSRQRVTAMHFGSGRAWHLESKRVP